MQHLARFALAVVALTCSAAAVVGCSTPEAPARGAAALPDNAVVLDVRNPDEWDAGHLEKSTLIPLPELATRLGDVEKLTGGDKSRPIVVVCRSGTRAGRAKELLAQQGYTNVTNGGAWQSLQPKP
jgi:phage shock protein E